MDRVVVLGLGVSGKSVIRYLSSKQIPFVGMDHNFEGYPFEVLSDKDPLPDDIIGVVRSPGISKSHRIIQECERRELPVITDLELAFSDERMRNGPCFGVTGTNGKTTTVSFLVYLLEQLGVQAVGAGNIGTPLLECLDFIGVKIVEISSFQLEMALDFPVLQGAAILNLSSNHLDFHGNEDNYYRAKARIYKYLKKDAPLFVGCSIEGLGERLATYQDFVHNLLDKESALKEFYLHDVENYSAAYALAQQIVEVPKEAFLHAIRSFKKPDHRLEFVAQMCGVQYINDSKATTFGAVKAAVEAVSGAVILLLGGRNKGADFTVLAEILRESCGGKIKRIIAYGESREAIFSALKSFFVTEVVWSLEEAVYRSAAVAERGDVVLLSPGCASFDAFSNFEHRGNIFKQIVFDLQESRL